MHRWKPSFIQCGGRYVSAVKNKVLQHKMLTMRGCCALLLLLTTGGWIAPVAVVAAPAMPADGAVFDITWLESCATPPPAAVTALEYAAELWGTWISSTVTITASACWTTLGGDVLGTGKPTQYVQNFTGAPLVNTYYPIALANALSGQNLRPGTTDITLQFNQDVDWAFETQRLHGSAASADFVTVALHELAHGLGFIGNLYEDHNVGFCGHYLYPCPTPYDWFAADSNGVPLLDSVDPLALGALLKNDANFGGPNTRAANSGKAAKLTLSPFELGNRLTHLDQDTFGGTANRLMTPNYGGATRHPGPVTLAIFQDMGWLRADGVPNVVTSGPRIVGVGTATPFTGTLLWDGYNGQPMTYTWTMPDQGSLVHPGLADSDTVTLTWATPGEKTLTLTATDGASPASAVRTMLAFAANVTGPPKGETDRAYTFIANVTLADYPVTYTWEATGQTPVTSGDNNVTFTWPVSGTQTITVTAVIEGAPTLVVHTITLEETIYHYIYLPLVQRQ